MVVRIISMAGNIQPSASGATSPTYDFICALQVPQMQLKLLLRCRGGRFLNRPKRDRYSLTESRAYSELYVSVNRLGTRGRLKQHLDDHVAFCFRDLNSVCPNHNVVSVSALSSMDRSTTVSASLRKDDTTVSNIIDLLTSHRTGTRTWTTGLVLKVSQAIDCWVILSSRRRT